MNYNYQVASRSLFDRGGNEIEGYKGNFRGTRVSVLLSHLTSTRSFIIRRFSIPSRTIWTLALTSARSIQSTVVGASMPSMISTINAVKYSREMMSDFVYWPRTPMMDRLVLCWGLVCFARFVPTA